MTNQGVVRNWDDDQGFGAIDSPDTPGGCWAGFPTISMNGYRMLTPGDAVTFTFETVSQNGYRYRAVHVWPPGVEPGTSLDEPIQEFPGAYRSTLTIRWHGRAGDELG